MFWHFASRLHFAKFLKYFAAMQLLMLTGLLQFAPPSTSASDALVLGGGGAGAAPSGIMGVGAQPLNENLAQLNRHQLRQFRSSLLARLEEGGAGDATGALRERRSLANGRWGLRPGKRSAGGGGGGGRLIAADRPGAFADESTPTSSASSGVPANDFRDFDLRPLLISAPLISRMHADDALDGAAPLAAYAPPLRFANFRFFMMPPY